jgi:acetylornithine aminotransferase
MYFGHFCTGFRISLGLVHDIQVFRQPFSFSACDWSERMTASMPHVMNTYGRLPIALSHGQGCHVWDTEGRRYIDGLGGIAVNTLGHAHPKLVPALQEQIAKLIHCSNYYENPLQERLAAKLCELSGLSVAFFCSTGLEANEGALKIARKYGHDKGIARPEIIVFD